MNTGPRPAALAVVCLLAGALGLRLAAAALVERSLPAGQLCLIAGDAEGYWHLARTIVRGDDYAIYDPPRRILRMPGFPLALAGVMRVFGESPFAARVVLAIIGTGACGLVGWLARELFDPPTAMAALLLTAASPTMVLFSVLLLSETLFAAALTASLIAVARLWRSMRSPSPLRWLPACGEGLLAGLFFGLATLVRPTWILVGPAVAVAACCLGRGRVVSFAAAGCVLAGLVACLLPWTLRNWHVTEGRFVPTTLWVGPSLYDGLHPGADGSSDMRFIETDGVYQRMSEYDSDRHYRRAAWDFARTNPGRAIQLGLVKLGRYFSPWPNAAQFRHPAASAGAVLLFAGTMLPAAVAVWRRRRQVATWVLLLAPLLYFAAIHTVFVGSLRYRLPAEYPLLVLTAAGLLDFLKRPKPS